MPAQHRRQCATGGGAQERALDPSRSTGNGRRFNSCDGYSGHRSFGIGVDRKQAIKCLDSQEKATYHRDEEASVDCETARAAPRSDRLIYSFSPEEKAVQGPAFMSLRIGFR